MPEKEFSNEFVKHVFDEAEKKDLAEDLARNIADLEQAENERKAVASDYKSQIDRLRANVNQAAAKLNNGYEMRTVKCEVSRDYKNRTVSFMDASTGKVVKKRDMKPDELQMKL